MDPIEARRNAGRPNSPNPPERADTGNSGDPTRRFSSRVENYVRFRPGYPPEVVEFITAAAGLKSAAAIADAGSGTGIFSECLCRAGFRVIGVEPNLEMRQAAETRLKRFPEFQSRDGRAEATGLPGDSVELVTAAQAFHWFDRRQARAEFRRILKSPGFAALIWNERKTEETAFLRAYENLLLERARDYQNVRHENVSSEVIRDFFAPFELETRRFSNVQQFDFEGLAGRLLSSSYAPLPGDAHHAEMMRELKEIFDRFNDNGRVSFLYDTVVYVARMK